MELSLVTNVYLVEGYANGAIYDLNHKKLYSLKKREFIFLSNALESKNPTLNNEESEFIHELIQLDIVVDGKVNSIYHKIELDQPKIEYAWIEITEKCNLECTHCYGTYETKSSEMTIEDFRYTIKKLKELGIKRIQIIGGEPLLYSKGIFPILSEAIKTFNHVEVFTNGTLIDEKFSKYCELNNIDVAVSLYSNSDIDHNRVTQNSFSFEKTMKGINLLKKYNVSFRISQVAIKDIKCDIQSDIYDDNKVSRDILRISGKGGLHLYSNEMLFNKLITSDKFKKELNPKKALRNMSYHNCYSKKIYISSDLSVYPCVMERRVNHGNLREIVGFKESIIHLNKDKINGCKICEYRYACNDCRPDSLSKEILSKPWYCSYEPQKGEWLDKNEFSEKLFSQS